MFQHQYNTVSIQVNAMEHERVPHRTTSSLIQFCSSVFIWQAFWTHLHLCIIWSSSTYATMPGNKLALMIWLPCSSNKLWMDNLTQFNFFFFKLNQSWLPSSNNFLHPWRGRTNSHFRNIFWGCLGGWTRDLTWHLPNWIAWLKMSLPGHLSTGTWQIPLKDGKLLVILVDDTLHLSWGLHLSLSAVRRHLAIHRRYKQIPTSFP